ncbi:hypothetical protein [Sphaerochaeta sp.]|uniref:hypothetical protein n=1 Tax=Sphaerochaeta sp. TaxID=1972642 RepID=UPI003D0E5608
MKRPDPTVKSTVCSQDRREWVPSSVENFLQELDHLVQSGAEDDHLLLFRGQSDSGWLLDSTLVRDAIPRLFGYQAVPNSIRQKVAFHRLIASMLLMKFGGIWTPSREAFEAEKNHGIDPWFELLKNAQQYPEKYETVDFIKGTFFIDWTISPEVGLYFAVYAGQRGSRRIDDTDGALWIYDSSSTGNILQEDKLEKIMHLMTGSDFLNGDKTFPLMFHPRQQTTQVRASNQKPVYIAQMDFRYDLADVWASHESQANQSVFIKLCVPQNLKTGLAEYLEAQAITEEYVYPH